MSFEGIKHAIVYLTALCLGIAASFVSFITPIKEEIPELLKKPTPMPVLEERAQMLSQEEQATMSGSFIKEFEMIVSSRSGEEK